MFPRWTPSGTFAVARTAWIEPKHRKYLVPVQALSPIFRAKLCAALNQADLLAHVPPALWQQDWVVHCQPAGRGEQVLDYLGRYLFRVAIPNSRLERLQDGHVTFRYRDNRTQTLRRVTLPAVEFLHRFLQHVLPRGCTKVRYYGLWSPTCRGQLAHARTLLSTPPPAASLEPAALPPPDPPASHPLPVRCPHCQVGTLILVEVLAPHRSRSP